MIDRVIDTLYSMSKSLVIASGMWVIIEPPHEWIGTISSAVMVIAGLVSIYAIWARKPSLEFVALWFVCVGIGAYTGFVWAAFIAGGVTFARAAVTTMLLIMLVARGLHLWRLVKQINLIERRIENHVE
jgi:hypothetical protein